MTVETIDEYGEMRGAPHTPAPPNGATRETAMPDDRARLGHYDAIPTRSRKGRTSFRVTARRPRHMTGLDHAREVTSASNYDVTGWADDFIRYQAALALGAGYVNEARDLLASFVPMLGSDAMSWEAIRHGDASDTDRYGVARHRSDVTADLARADAPTTRVIRGLRADGTPYRMVDRGSFGDAYSDRTATAPTIARMPARYSVRHAAGTRRDVPAIVRETVVCAPVTDLGHAVRDDCPQYVPAVVTALVAATGIPGKVWQGHRLVDAAPTSGKHRNAARTAARAEARAAAPRAEWADAAEALSGAIAARTSEIIVDGVRVVFGTPGSTGRFRAVLTYLDGTTRTIQARTAAPIARAIVNA